MHKRTRIKITAIVAVLAAGTVMAQAYRWTDAEGVVHYSDRPQEGAEEIVLQHSNRAAPVLSPQAQSSQSDNTDTPAAPFSYESVSISTPAAEETLWNIEGVLDVTLNVQPALQAGHQVRVYFDGEQNLVSGANFQLQEVHRGAHSIQAEVLDESGRLMGRSQPNRFYVQQNTVSN